MSYSQVTYRWLKSLSGLSSLSVPSLSVWTGGVRLVAFIGLMSLLSACMTPLSLLTGGGPNVAANTQIGKENNQGINIDYQAPAQSTIPQIRPEGNVNDINQVNNISEINPLMLLLLILGWLAPSPGEIGRGIVSLFKRKE
jgi:hypothetical protein